VTTRRLTDSFAPQTLAEPFFVEEAYDQARPPVAAIEIIEADLAEKAAVVLDDPGMRMRGEAIDPGFRRCQGERQNGSRIGAEHAHHLGRISERKASLRIAVVRRPQGQTWPFQHGHYEGVFTNLNSTLSVL